MQESKTMQIVNAIYDVLDASPKAFGGGGDVRKVSVETVYGMLDEIRETFPTEFADARRTVRSADEIIASANDRAARIIEDANLQAERITGEHEIVRRAQLEADRIASDAKLKSVEAMAAADDYAERAYDKAMSDLAAVSEELAAMKARSAASAKGVQQQ